MLQAISLSLYHIHIREQNYFLEVFVLELIEKTILNCIKNVSLDIFGNSDVIQKSKCEKVQINCF